MENSCPVWSATCMHLEPPKNYFKLLKIYMTKWPTCFYFYFEVFSANDCNINMFLIYGEPLPNKVCTLPLPETTFKFLKNYIWELFELMIFYWNVFCQKTAHLSITFYTLRILKLLKSYIWGLYDLMILCFLEI